MPLVECACACVLRIAHVIPYHWKWSSVASDIQGIGPYNTISPKNDRDWTTIIYSSIKMRRCNCELVKFSHFLSEEWT